MRPMVVILAKVRLRAPRDVSSWQGVSAPLATDPPIRMTQSAFHPPKVSLRLVRPEEELPRAQRAEVRDVALENRLAALSADDVRLSFATQVATRIEGGKAAILRPAARERLLSEGKAVGLRPFDVSLVIAIVQDAARRGEGVATGPVSSRLGLVGPGEGARRDWWPLVLGVVLGLVMLAGLVWVVEGG